MYIYTKKLNVNTYRILTLLYWSINIKYNYYISTNFNIQHLNNHDKSTLI